MGHRAPRCKSIRLQGIRPSILKVFAFSCRIVFRLIFFTFGNLTILVFFLNDQRIDKWRTILLGDTAAFVGKTSQKLHYLYTWTIDNVFWNVEKLESCYFALILLDCCLSMLVVNIWVLLSLTGDLIGRKTSLGKRNTINFGNACLSSLWCLLKPSFFSPKIKILSLNQNRNTF